MYRTVTYFHPLGRTYAHEAVALRSEAMDHTAAVDLLADLLELPQTTGGHLEVEVPGVGWVSGDQAQHEIDRHNEATSWYDSYVPGPVS